MLLFNGLPHFRLGYYLVLKALGIFIFGLCFLTGQRFRFIGNGQDNRINKIDYQGFLILSVPSTGSGQAQALVRSFESPGIPSYLHNLLPMISPGPELPVKFRQVLMGNLAADDQFAVLGGLNGLSQ